MVGDVGGERRRTREALVFYLSAVGNLEGLRLLILSSSLGFFCLVLEGKTVVNIGS